MTTTASSAARIIIYPFPAPGHIIPLLDLTHHLLNHNITITLFITQNTRSLIEPLLSSHPQKLHHLILPDPKVQIHGLLSYMSSLHKTHYPIILNWIQSQSYSSSPAAIISDFFLGWTQQLASEVGIPRIVFSASSYFAFSVTASLWLNQPRCVINPDDNDFVVSFPDIPDSPSYPWWQISHVYRTSDVGDPDRQFFKDCYLANLTSWGIVVNSFAELERVYVDHLKKKYGNDRVFTVGPLLTEAENRGGPSSTPRHQVLTWLDDKRVSSVIYISFGSREMLTCKQMDELSSALEKSEVNFVWSARLPNEGHVASDEYGLLPDGFEDRVSGRGLIIKGWAPQVDILKHRAVGSFLTHCGWNSVLEGIAAGVVMLTWPLGADQFMNAELVVDKLGVGIRVGEDEHKIPESNELARILNESLQENRMERVKVNELREAALKGGCSSKDFNRLLKQLSEL